MADTTDLLNQILSRLDEQGRDIKSVKQDVSTLKDVQQEQGKEIKAVKGEVVAIRREHGEKLDRLEDGQNRHYTTMKALQGTIEETKAEVDKILRRPRQAD
jgi:chromosome segregation ATPase